MKRTIFYTLTLLLAFTRLFSQEIVFSETWWQDPAVFEINQTKPHSKIIPYNITEQALTFNQDLSPFYLSLDGTWKFLLVDHPRMVPEGFWKPGFDVNKWYNLPVPSHWEMEGFGHPKFRNVHMTIETKPPMVPDNYNPTGCYKRTFNLSQEWNDREIMLRFEGVKSASYIWVNGHPVGYNQGGFEPAEYNITSYLKPGENDIAVKVLRYSDGAFMENQDMWRISGIFRSVALIAKPKVHIHDYYVTTEFNKAYRDANLHVSIDIQNAAGVARKGYSVEISLFDKKQNPVFLKPLIQSLKNIEKGTINQVKFSVPVKQPLQWSAEKPDLYTLLITLKDQNGKIAEVTAKRMGFRQTEIKDGAIWVNGAMVKLNGVNSHMHHPEHGQAVPFETLRKDLIIMKQFNINIVRTSHYPPSPEYLDLADELGMYIVPDAGVECHDNEQLSGQPEWERQFVDRGVKMVYRDRNHPCIIFWSGGNEAGKGENLKVMIEDGKKIDPSRNWMYGGNDFFISFEDIIGPRYWTPLEIKNLAEDKVLRSEDQRPSFQDEYLAATGNGLGGLDEYWELIWKYPRITGGAIWDWVSPAVKMSLIFTPDGSSLKNHPTIMGRPDFVSGKTGKAIRFSGHDDWVEFYRHPDLDLNGNELTIEFWVRPEENIQPNTFVTKGSHQFGILQPNHNEIEFYVHTNRRFFVKSLIPDKWYNNWHHVAGIYNGEKIELYIDFEKAGEVMIQGNLKKSVSLGDSFESVEEKQARINLQNTPYPVCLGRDAELHDQGEFRGRLSICTMDELRIYGKALSIAELKDQTTDEAEKKSVASLSFEDTLHEGYFFSTGLGGRTYGIIWADRTVQPEIYQVKKSAQPVLIETEDIEKGIFKVTNRHNFTNLNELSGKWNITSNGVKALEGDFTLNCAPGNSAELMLPLAWNKLNPENDQWITISFLLKENKPWADTGHETAWEQFLYPSKQVHSPSSGINLPPVSVEETAGSLVITGKDFRYVLDTKTGKFIKITFKDTELLQPGMDLSVWRAPLANDMDHWGSNEFTKSNYTPGLGRSIENQLRTLGLDNLKSEVYKINKKILSTGDVLITLVIYSTGKTLRFVRGAVLETGFEEHREYIFSADGTINLNHKIIPHGDMPSLLPRVGLDFHLPLSFSRVEWYGRGPFETYPDRKTGAKVGVWSLTVENEFVPYLIPQDHGNKTDVRWLKISNDEKAGFLISGSDLLNFSAHKYSTDNLTRAVHLFQLKEADFITLSVNYEVTGVGDTSRRTLAKYRVLPSVKEYGLIIKPFKE